MDTKRRDEGRKEEESLEEGKNKKEKEEKRREGWEEGVFGQVESFRWGLVRKV